MSRFPVSLFLYNFAIKKKSTRILFLRKEKKIMTTVYSTICSLPCQSSMCVEPLMSHGLFYRCPYYLSGP